jgi:hypothetical protein
LTLTDDFALLVDKGAGIWRRNKIADLGNLLAIAVPEAPFPSYR